METPSAEEGPSLGQITKKVVKWMPDEKMVWTENRNSRNGVLISERIALSHEVADKLNISTCQMRPERLSRSLDAIRVVELCLIEDNKEFEREYILNLWEITDNYAMPDESEVLSKPKDKLEAIYQTLVVQEEIEPIQNSSKGSEFNEKG